MMTWMKMMTNDCSKILQLLFASNRRLFLHFPRASHFTSEGHRRRMIFKCERFRGMLVWLWTMGVLMRF